MIVPDYPFYFEWEQEWYIKLSLENSVGPFQNIEDAKEWYRDNRQGKNCPTCEE